MPCSSRSRLWRMTVEITPFWEINLYFTETSFCHYHMASSCLIPLLIFFTILTGLSCICIVMGVKWCHAGLSLEDRCRYDHLLAVQFMAAKWHTTSIGKTYLYKFHRLAPDLDEESCSKPHWEPLVMTYM
jgi:hypothetical protein